MSLDNYKLEEFYDEMMSPERTIRPEYRLLADKLCGLDMEELRQKQHAAERLFVSLGITFSLYDESKGSGGIERIIPFDIIPRIIDAAEWERVDRGLVQRVTALDLFLSDVYGEQRVIRDGIVPRDIIYSSPGFLSQCIGLQPPKWRWTHISGIDLIRHSDGNYHVLEDNVRVPSGVAYVLGNREIMKRVFPFLFGAMDVAPVYDYPLKLLEMLQYLSDVENPTVAVLTPGIFNSAYFEHSFLAQQMGVQLVEGRDLIVENHLLYMRTTRGLQRVDVIYRRVDDTFLDPLVFNPDSALGVPGLFDVYQRGNVAIANAPGTGVADDKVIYAYMPQIIKYFLEEDPILPNVPTYLCWEKKQRQHVIDNIRKMVVKMDNQSGGYGMLIGPQASESEIRTFRERIEASPRSFIAQPVMGLSRVPTIIDDEIEGRHVDLRPFVLYGKTVNVMPGGLSRVALRRGSLVVNSSQGGGSKDTWVATPQPEDAVC